MDDIVNRWQPVDARAGAKSRAIVFMLLFCTLYWHGLAFNEVEAD